MGTFKFILTKIKWNKIKISVSWLENTQWPCVTPGYYIIGDHRIVVCPSLCNILINSSCYTVFLIFSKLEFFCPPLKSLNDSKLTSRSKANNDQDLYLVPETKLGCLCLIWFKNLVFEVLVTWIVTFNPRIGEFSLLNMFGSTRLEMSSLNDYILALSWKDTNSRRMGCSRCVPKHSLQCFFSNLDKKGQFQS